MGVSVPASDKLRGGYYTSPSIAQWITAWAVTSARDSILEPSCGDGVFLESAVQRLRDFGASASEIAAQLVGVELDPIEANKSRRRIARLVEGAGLRMIECRDFFAWIEDHTNLRFDCVLGNPPFIRYQNFPEPSRTLAMDQMSRLGLHPNRLTNIWVPFVTSAAAMLKPGGRLAMVVPAELLQVSYAAQLRSFLVDHFESITIVACNEMLFEGAQQEVVLLMAKGRVASPSSLNRCRMNLLEFDHMRQLLDCRDLNGQGNDSKIVRHESEKWLKYFLTGREIGLMRELRESGRAAVLRRYATVDVGVVTGNNDFFVLDAEEVERHALQQYIVPLVGRSAQLKGAIITAAELTQIAAGGDRVHLLCVDARNGEDLTSGLRAYIRRGESEKVHLGYKCMIRDPWYRVPSVWAPDGFLFRQIHDFPRVVLNLAGAVSTDTIHRVMCKTNKQLLFRNLYTHLTAASSEIEGRSYGGGVLELEPTEAERLLVPRELSKNALPIEEIDRLVREGRLSEALHENDRRILIEGMGLSSAECAMLAGIWRKMRDRRTRRRKADRSYLTYAEADLCIATGSIAESGPRNGRYADKSLVPAKPHRPARNRGPKRRAK